MPDTATGQDYKELIRQAKTWPSIAELAADYDVPERWVRLLVQRGKVEAVKIDVIRINPESWEAFLATRHYRTA